MESSKNKAWCPVHGEVSWTHRCKGVHSADQHFSDDPKSRNRDRATAGEAVTYGRDTRQKRDRARKGKMRSGEPCICGCESWVATTAGSVLCGYCAWPDATTESAKAARRRQ